MTAPIAHVTFIIISLHPRTKGSFTVQKNHPTSTTDIHYMRLALELAREAAADGEVPVGALIVQKGEIIAAARNRREKGKSAILHAELEAIGIACEKLGGWRLPDCTLYVTLEPCPMCAGAIVNSRIPRIVFGAGDPRAGAFGSMLDLRNYPLGHKPEITRGILQEECAALLRDFFKSRRK